MTTTLPQGTWVRSLLTTWLSTSMLGLWLMMFSEWFFPLGLSHLHTFLFCACYVPFPFCLRSALRLRSGTTMRSQSSLSDAGCVLLGLSVFGLWTGSYYLMGWVGSFQEMRTLTIPADRWFPLFPSTSFVYVSVQWFIMVAVMESADALPWRNVLKASAFVLLVCNIFFVFLPVEIRPDAVQVTDVSTWVLSLIRKGDVAHNCFPSSHCAFALLGALYLFHKSRWKGWLGLFCAISIGISTLTTKQHYVLDVIVGFALAGVAYVWFVRGKEEPV